MSRKPKLPSKPDDDEQSRLFIEKAREIEANEEGASEADEIMRRLRGMKPQPRKGS